MAVDENATPLERVVRKVVRAYPVPAWSAGQVTLWLEMLEDLDVLFLAQVAGDWIRTKRERPTIADIRAGVADLQIGNANGAKLFLPVDEAWAYVRICFGTVGRYRDFPEEHPLIKQAVDAMGWREMCSSDNVDVVRGQFRKLYGELLARSIAQSAASDGAAAPPGSAAALEQRQPRQIGARS